MLSMSALKERSLQSLVIKFFISSYNSLFTLEAKLKIPLMIEKLNCLLKWLEAYFNLDRIREEQQNSFSCLKMSSHALVLWESYVDALRVGKKPIVIKWNTSRNNQSIINNAWRGSTQEMAISLARIRTKCSGLQVEFLKASHHVGISLEELGVVVMYLGGLHGHIRIQL